MALLHAPPLVRADDLRFSRFVNSTAGRGGGSCVPVIDRFHPFVLSSSESESSATALCGLRGPLPNSLRHARNLSMISPKVSIVQKMRSRAGVVSLFECVSLRCCGWNYGAAFDVEAAGQRALHGLRASRLQTMQKVE